MWDAARTLRPPLAAVGRRCYRGCRNAKTKKRSRWPIRSGLFWLIAGKVLMLTFIDGATGGWWLEKGAPKPSPTEFVDNKTIMDRKTRQ